MPGGTARPCRAPCQGTAWGVLDPSGWLCQSQGTCRPQAWQALQPSEPGWAPGRSCWQGRVNPSSHRRPCSSPQEQHRSHPGPLIPAGCSQLVLSPTKHLLGHVQPLTGVWCGKPRHRRQQNFDSWALDQGPSRATHGHNKAAEGTVQGCGSQFFPTNTERNLLMVAEHELPRGKEPRDRKGTTHFTSPAPRFNVGP